MYLYSLCFIKNFSITPFSFTRQDPRRSISVKTTTTPIITTTAVVTVNPSKEGEGQRKDVYYEVTILDPKGT